MKCAYHKDREATSKCAHCGKPLCDECSNLTNINICMDCFHKSIRKSAHEERNMPKPTIILGAIGLITGFLIGAGMYTLAIMAVCMLIPSGYIFLVNFDRGPFMKIPYVGELLYYLIKLVISPIVGIYALPKYCYLLIKNK